MLVKVIIDIYILVGLYAGESCKVPVVTTKFQCDRDVPSCDLKRSSYQFNMREVLLILD